MKRFLVAIFTATLFCCATSAMATSFYYQATDVSGFGEVTYDTTGTAAPTFTFTGEDGDVDTNMGGFVAGNYTVDVTLTGFWLDVNEDGNNDYELLFANTSLGPYDIPLIPLAGTTGALTWNVDPYSSLYLSYDFGTTGTYTNQNVSLLLAGLDAQYGDGMNGFMNADMGWKSFRVELTSTAPVPEPATLLLLGSGLAGLAFLKRRKS